jgi:hypothetical protein
MKPAKKGIKAGRDTSTEFARVCYRPSRAIVVRSWSRAATIRPLNKPLILIIPIGLCHCGLKFIKRLQSLCLAELIC